MRVLRSAKEARLRQLVDTRVHGGNEVGIPMQVQPPL